MSRNDWDVNEYKAPSESSEQWRLRRAFLERWKNEIPEDRLVCLARAFINVEFLGCRYPAPVMRQIAELSAEVAREYREKKKNRIQRTFVSATDAAEDKVKRTKRNHSDLADANCTTSTSKRITFTPSERSDSSNNQKDPSTVKNSSPKNLKTSENISIRSIYGDLILMDKQINTSFVEKVTVSCQTCKVPYDWECDLEENNWICRLKINNVLVAEGVGETKKIAKCDAAQKSWNILQAKCYTIKTIQRHGKEDKKILVGDVGEKDTNFKDALDVKFDSVIGLRMMKSMGWKGGALGTSANGISEPIKPNLKQIHRAGLGSSSANSSITNSLKKVISDFKNDSNAQYDLIFANDFTKEERAEMHKIALRFGLKSKSYGRDAERYLVVCKSMTPQELLKSLLSCGGATDKYELLPPIC